MKLYRLRSVLLWGGCLMLCLSACRSKEKHQNRREDVLALVGSSTITLNDFKDALNRQSPYFRNQYANQKRRKEFLNNLVQFHILLLEAKRQGLLNRPRVRMQRNRAIVQQLMEQQLRKLQPKDIKPAALQAYYNKNRKHFYQPEQRTARQILFRLPPHFKPKQREEKYKILLGEMKRIRAKGQSEQGFLEMVKKYSNDRRSRVDGGKVGPIQRNDDRKLWPQPVLKAIFAHNTIGKVFGPIRSKQGFHVLRLEKINPGHIKPLDQIQNIVRQRVLKEERKALFQAYLRTLRKRYTVKINDAVFQQVVAKAKAQKPKTN